MNFSLEHKTAVVTGATKGIGKAIACALAEKGADLVVVSRHQDDCGRTAKELEQRYGVRTLPVSADITKQEDISRLTETAESFFGHIDILVNNAGAAITKKAEDLTPEDWDRVLNLDLRAVFFCSQAIGRCMIAQKSGVIINIASALGVVADKQVLPYCTAKAGVLQMTKALALEWAKYNIRVNAICPGYVITDMNRAELTIPQIADGLLRKFAIRRFAEAEELGGAAVFLASDASSYMTGQSILLDGGWTIQ